MSIGIAVRGYLSVCRISNLPSIWTNVLCAAVLATGTFSWQSYLVPALAISSFYLAGMCLNDICDVSHDAVHRPSRPIPSGSVSLTGAILLTVALFSTGLFALVHSCREATHAAMVLIGAIVWYDLDHKKNPYSVLVMASCRFLIFMVTALAVAGKIPAAVVIAGGIHFTYIVVLSIVARYENGRRAPFSLPVIPLLLAGIPLLDGLILALLVAPFWLMAGVIAALLMQEAQRHVRGD